LLKTGVFQTFNIIETESLVFSHQKKFRKTWIPKRMTDN